MLSSAKEEVYTFSYWFRKKYNLTPTDPRFLEMTPETIKKEFFLERLSENPEFKLEDMEKDNSADDDWMKMQESDSTNEFLKNIFEGKIKEDKPKIETKVMASGLSPIEMARNKVKVSVKSKFDKPLALGGDDEEFEEVFRETND